LQCHSSAQKHHQEASLVHWPAQLLTNKQQHSAQNWNLITWGTYVYIVAVLLEHKAYSLKSDTEYINCLQQGLLYLPSNTYDLICSRGFVSL
jgi:uncharacterized membrane protein (DUF2068 family)